MQADRHRQSNEHNERHESVVGQHQEEHERQTHQAGDDGGSKRIAAKGWRYGLHLGHLELHGYRAELENLRKVARILLREVTGDLHLAAGEHGLLHHRRRNHFAVEDDGHLRGWTGGVARIATGRERIPNVFALGATTKLHDHRPTRSLDVR